MTKIVTKHKVLLIALCGVLCIGILSGLLLTGVIKFSKEGRSFSTVAEAKEEADKETGENDAPDKMPVPTPTPETKQLSAREISEISEWVQRRRQYVIPIRTGIGVASNLMLWDVSNPSQEQEELAKDAASQFTEKVFEQSYETLTGFSLEEASVAVYTDKNGDRDTVLRVTDPAGNYIVSFDETTWKVLCADLLTYPKEVTIDREKDALRLAEKLGYQSAVLYRDRNNEWMNEAVYMLTTDKDECLAFSYCGNQLWQFALYPSQQAMLECEYFLADIQIDYETPAYPRNFVEAEAPNLPFDQMLPGDKIIIRLKRLYNQLSGDSKIMNSNEMKAVFYRDESGAREDCWVITGKGFEVTVSAYSRDVIRLDCSIPCKDLLAIPYEKMSFVGSVIAKCPVNFVSYSTDCWNF